MGATDNESKIGMKYMTKAKKKKILDYTNSEEIVLKKYVLEKKFYNKAIIKLLTEEVTCKEDLLDCMSKPSFYGTSDLIGFHKAIRDLKWIEYPEGKIRPNPIRFKVLKNKILDDMMELLFYYPVMEKLELIKKFYVNVLHEDSAKEFIQGLNEIHPKLSTYFIEDTKDFFIKEIVYKDKKKRHRETLDRLSKKEFVDLIDFAETRIRIAKYISSIITNKKIWLHRKDYSYAKKKILQGINNIKMISEYRYKNDTKKQEEFIKNFNLILHFKPLQIRIKENELIYKRKLKSVSILTGSLIASDEFLNAVDDYRLKDRVRTLIKNIKDQRKKSKNLAKITNSKEGIFDYRIKQSSTRKIFKHL